MGHREARDQGNRKGGAERHAYSLRVGLPRVRTGGG